MEDITKVLILGSCVSRDSFGSPVTDESGFSLAGYYARTSLASLGAKRVTTKIDLSSIESKFQRSMVERDLKKGFFASIKNIDYDVLLLDFIDDRFNLLLLPDESAITDSSEFRRSNHKHSSFKPKKVAPFSDEFFSHWERGWNLLKNELVSLNRLDKLLVNKVYWSTHDDAGTAFENSDATSTANEYLDMLYTRLHEVIPEGQFIDYQSIDFKGSTSHQWGRSPFHYTEELYQHCRRTIKDFHSNLLS